MLTYAFTDDITHPLDSLNGVLDLKEMTIRGEDRDGAVIPEQT